MEGQRTITVENVKVKELKSGDFEGTAWFQLLEDCGMVNPKHKLHGHVYGMAIEQGIQPGDVLNLKVEWNYYPKGNCFVPGKVLGFEKVDSTKKAK